MSDNLKYVAANKPILTRLVAGKKYAWCTCKHSKTQPFCDGSHKGTDMKPMVFTADKDEEVLLCACKATASGPYCDGAHNNLEDTYAEATTEEVLSMKNSAFVARDDNGKALLDGGAYVLSPATKSGEKIGNINYLPVIDHKDGATKLSLYQLELSSGTSPWLQYADVDTVLYIADGHGTVDIAGKEIAIEENTGIYVRPGEAFRLRCDDAMTVFAAVCPIGPELLVAQENSSSFQSDYQQRSVTFDRAKASVMANRVYQELIDKKVGSHQVTQFIGELPQSRAAMHRHLYEEAIVILTGHGRMWTGTKWAEVKVGDVIFLPHRQGHSLECMDAGGMRLMGVFYPSGSPAINY